MTLGRKIKKLRTDKNLTQKDLADQLHVTFQTVSKWENDENEPDIATLKELAKLFDCSFDYLLSDEGDEESKIEDKEVVVPEPAPEQVTKTIIIHQKELHVCEHCKKDIEEGDLEIEHVKVHGGGRGRSATYRDAYYHKACLEEVRRERAIKAAKERTFKAQRAKKLSFGWGIFGGVVALAISLLVFLLTPELAALFEVWLSILISVGIGYGVFAALYCIISGSYIGEVFVTVSSWSIRFPGLIFTWDLSGLAWLIVMKILFLILGVMFSAFVLGLAVSLSVLLAIFSFPFVLIHNINTNYENAC